MNYKEKRRLLGLLFWMKAGFAFCLAFGSLAYIAWEISYQHQHPPLGEFDRPGIPFADLDSVDAPRCFYKNDSSSLARLESPDMHSFILGFSLDWSVDTPSLLSERTKGLKPSLFNSYIAMSETEFEKEMITWQARHVRKLNAALQISLMPNVSIQNIQPQTYRMIAKHMRFVNSEIGVPVFLRFGHEMNGPWMVNYGMRPLAYKRAFITLASEVRKQTNLTAMVWAPNLGNSYPFGLDPYNPTNGPHDEFMALDTNGDGILDIKDDPYEPYFPGPEWVDWVGLSIYNYNYSSPTGQAYPSPQDAFTSQKSGSTIINGGTKTDQYNFYHRFVESTHRPFMFSETGASYNVGPGVTTGQQPKDAQQLIELQIKQAWINSILDNAATNFTRMRSAIWFEEQKSELSSIVPGQFVWRDYRITYNDSLKDSIIPMLKNEHMLRWADSFTYSCNGTVAIVN